MPFVSGLYSNKSVDEFQGMNPKDVVPYIEGDPLISVVPVESGLTNTATEKHYFLCADERWCLTNYCQFGGTEG